jgi:hypothetical protein
MGSFAGAIVTSDGLQVDPICEAADRFAVMMIDYGAT